MNAKEFLRQPKKLDKLIENKLIEKEQWKNIAIGTTSQMNSERVQSSGSQQKMADAVGKFVDIENEIDEYIEKLIDVKKDVISVIEELNATEYDILHKVYIQYITLEEISILYGKTYSWSTTVHGRALKNVQKILNERGKSDEKNC